MAAEEPRGWSPHSPRARPVRSIAELHVDVPFLIAECLADGHHRSPTASLEKRRERGRGSGPSLLLCHDMKGGYLEDAEVAGNKGSGAAYSFPYWSIVESFVYFSHERVSVPPPSWVAAGHRNGSRVLGTLITEWAEGERENEVLLQEWSAEDTSSGGVALTEPVLDDMDQLSLLLRLIGVGEEGEEAMEEAIAMLLSRSPSGCIRFKSTIPLVLLAVFCNFDGYLVNIESRVQAGRVPDMVAFVSELRWLMHEAQCCCSRLMLSLDGDGDQSDHQAGGRCMEPRIIWYDSVITTGDVRWQEEVNARNWCFFEAADAFFSNYCWTEAHLLRSVRAAASVDRQKALYMGIDVFGRSSSLPGGFRSMDVAQLAASMGASVAIFAPGWCFETVEADGKTEAQFRSAFMAKQQQLWASERSTVYDWPFVAGIPLHLPLLSQELPLHLTFNRGMGDAWYKEGQVAERESWSNLSLAGLQPTTVGAFSIQPHNSPHHSWTATWSFERVFEGGSSLRVDASPGPETKFGSGQGIGLAVIPILDFGIEGSIEDQAEVSFTAERSTGSGMSNIGLLLCDWSGSSTFLGSSAAGEIAASVSLAKTCAPIWHSSVFPSGFPQQEWEQLQFRLPRLGSVRTLSLVCILAPDCNAAVQFALGAVRIARLCSSNTST